MPRSQISACGIVCLFAFGIGCARQFPAYPQRAYADCPARNSGASLNVGADAIWNRKDIDRYFASDLRGKGILPVYVVVENRGASTFLVSPSSFSIKDANASGVKEVASKDGGGAVMTVGAVALSVGGVLIGGAMMADADNKNVQLRRQMLTEQTVSPGQTVRGFVYFELRGKPRPLAMRGAFKPVPASSGSTAAVDLSLNANGA